MFWPDYRGGRHINRVAVRQFYCLYSSDLFIDHSIEATEQNYPAVLFVMLFMVVLTFESVNGILKCDHSGESC